MLWGPDDWDAWTCGGTDSPEIGPHLDVVRSTLLKIPHRDRKSVADLGCGPGSLTPFLAMNFSDVTAIDYAPACLAMARDSCDEKNVRFRRRDLRDLSPFRSRFHVAVAIDSIAGPRPSDVDTMLAEIWASLMDGGLLLATFPAARNSREPFPMAGSEDRDPFGGLHEVELQYRFRRAGFQGVRIRRLSFRNAGEPRLLGLAVRRGMN